MGKHRKPSNAQGPSQSGQDDGPAKAPTPKRAQKPPRKNNSTQLLVEPRADWHAVQLPSINPNADDSQPLVPEVLINIQQYAEQLLTDESAEYVKTHINTSSDHKFMSTIMQTGTWSDKVSALTLVVQESPLHTSTYFENLLSLARKRSRDNALAALAALKDLLALGHLLPKERKLGYFRQQRGLVAALSGVKDWTTADKLPPGLTREHLIYWAYENWLKKSFFEILKLLQSWLNDAVENARTRSLDFVFELLKEKPEQEENLLRLLVNKLGDSNRKIASKASHRLLQLLTFHSAMKSVVAGAIEEEILFKPGQKNHARYYAAITLNQIPLSTGDPNTANKLLDVYFTVFTALLNKSKNQTENSTKAPQKSPKEQVQKRKRTSEAPPSSNEVDNPDKQLEDKLVAQILTGIHRAFPYSSQDNFPKLEAHIQTLFSITHSSNFGTSLRALTLLQTITSSHFAITSSSNLRDRYMRTLYESLLDPRLITATGKHTMYFNLLYRSLKNDSAIGRVKAFVKRLMQICNVHEPPFIVSVAFLIQELGKNLAVLKSMVSQVEIDAGESDEDEIFYDVPDSDDNGRVNGREAHDEPIAKDEADRKQQKSPKITYDPRKRDPIFAHAEMSSFWDLVPYMRHYHPSVSLFAFSFLPSAQQKSPPKPDPASHTMSHFLDRFAYRNPKPPRDPSSGDPKALHGSSIMQPALASTATADHFIAHRVQQIAQPVSSEDFWRRRAEEVAPEDVFFHRYFNAVGPSKKEAKDRKRKDQTAGTAMGEDEFDEAIGAGEDEIWKALVSSRPELESEGSEEEADDGEEESDEEEFAEAMKGGSEDELDADEGVELNLESDDEEDDADLPGGSGKNANGNIGKNLGDEFEERGGKEEEDDDSEEENEGDSVRTRRAKRRKLSRLPTFASIEDYTKMIEDAEADEDSA